MKTKGKKGSGRKGDKKNEETNTKKNEINEQKR